MVREVWLGATIQRLLPPVKSSNQFVSWIGGISQGRASVTRAAKLRPTISRTIGVFDALRIIIKSDTGYHSARIDIAGREVYLIRRFGKIVNAVDPRILQVTAEFTF